MPLPIRDLTLDGPHPPLPIRVYPAEAAGPRAGALLLWIHGGAFVGGSLDMPESDAVCRALSDAGVVCVAVGYRLAPRFGDRRAQRAPDVVRFPQPLDDCERAWQWARENAADLGAELNRCHVGGASAGGTLAATLTLRLIRAASPAPASVVLAYPLLHAELPPPGPGLRHSLRGLRRLGTFTQGSVRWMTRNYVGRDRLERLPEAFPGGADLSGFPPTLIVNSERDTLRASGECFAEELRGHARRVQVGYEPGTSHGHLNRPGKPGFDASIATIAEWLKSN